MTFCQRAQPVVRKLKVDYKEIMKQRAEIQQLRDALLWCAAQAWEGNDIDGGDFQNEMIERGIMVEVPASQEFKDEHLSDHMYVMAWSKKNA